MLISNIDHYIFSNQLFLAAVAKVFLDPLDNEEFTKNSIDMDVGVLIRESNGGSTLWKNSAASLPFDFA